MQPGLAAGLAKVGTHHNPDDGPKVAQAMRAPLVLGLLALATFAGCMDSPDPTPVGTQVDHSAAGPGAPQVDGAALVSELRTFAEEMPVRAANGPDHEAARDWLMAKFASFGLDTHRQDYDTANLE